MKNSRDLILGEVVYISIVYRIQDSCLYSLNGYDFSFDRMTGENREYNIRVFLSGSMRGGLMVGALDSGASGLGTISGQGHCVVFLVLLSTQVYKWVPAN